MEETISGESQTVSGDVGATLHQQAESQPAETKTDQIDRDVIPRREYNSAKEQIRKMENQLKDLSGPAALHQWLISDPSRAKHFISMMDELSGQKNVPEQDPYAEYDDFIAERLRRSDENARKLEELERYLIEQNRAAHESRVEAIRNQAEELYTSLLKKDGIEPKDGDPLTDGLDRMMAAFLVETAENPGAPTNDEIKAAYSKLRGSFNLMRKSGFSVKNSVPPSGSRVGHSLQSGPVGQLKTGTMIDRVNNILKYGMR